MKYCYTNIFYFVNEIDANYGSTPCMKLFSHNIMYINESKQ